MAKPRTQEEFSSQVTSDFTWRLRELSNLKLAISISGSEERSTYLRALVVMCYAHWEGHAKFCGERFLEFLTLRRLKFSELAPHFYNVRYLKEIASSSTMNYGQRSELINKILTSTEDRFSNFPKELIDTGHNLNSKILKELCLVCGINFDKFEADADFLDRLLLKRRNEVAHGEAVFIEAVDTEELILRTTKMMRTFRDELDNYVVLQQYRAEPT